MLPQLTDRLHSLRGGRSLEQFMLFLLVGVLNTAFGYGCFIVLVRLGLHYSLAALLSTILGVLFNFRTIGRIVFRNRNNRLLGRFIGIYVIVFGINLLGLRLGLMAGLGPYGTGAVLLLPLALLSYYLQRKFVFPANKAAGRP